MERLRDLQEAIDQIDGELIKLLARRFGHSREIGAIKRACAQPPYDPERIHVQNKRWIAGCVDQGLHGAMAQQLIAVIVAQVLVERIEALGLPHDSH